MAKPELLAKPFWKITRKAGAMACSSPSTSMTFSTWHSSAARTNCPIWVGSRRLVVGRLGLRVRRRGLDHAKHVDHASQVAEAVEVDQIDHAPDRPVCKRKHIASLDRCRRMSDPEIAAVDALQSEFHAYGHAASMPSPTASCSDPIVSYLALTASPTFCLSRSSIGRPLRPHKDERLLVTRRLIVVVNALVEMSAPTGADGVMQVIE